MRPILLLFTVTVAAAASAIPSAEDASSTTLVLVHALFRHGNRTPDTGSVYPTDQYVDFPYEPFGYGQLTTKGKVTEHNIGKWMRANYGDLIPAQYKATVVDAVATNYKRTKMSLELVLAGLFPPIAADNFDPAIGWQPIPYNVEVESLHPILTFNDFCPAYTNNYFSYVMSDAAQAIIEPYRNLYSTIGKITATEINLPFDLSMVYFTLKSEEDFGLVLPEWSKNYYPETLEEASGVEYEMQTGNDQLKRLSGGFLLKKILDDTRHLINGTLPADKKVFLYSAHEYNIGTMLRTLNVWYRHVPPFGATIFFEIHQIGGVYGLKLRYQDYKEADPRLLTIPGCGSFCPIDQLESLVKNQLPGDADQCNDFEEH